MTYDVEMEELNKQLETIDNFDDRMEIMDKMLDVKKKYGKVTPLGNVSPFECFGCGS